jgi:AbrB family looped-hinge helix DNA binding protein
MAKSVATCGIDKAGRIIIPKAMRERLQLLPGSEVSITEDGEQLHIARAVREGRLVRVHGRLVFTGGDSGEFDIDEAIEKVRSLRDEDVLRETRALRATQPEKSAPKMKKA